MIIIAIDGPAAAGKGTLAKRLAKTLKLPYLDTGLLYRATAKRVLESGGDPTDPLAATAAAWELSETDTARKDLRDASTSMAASQVASIPAVREALLAYQRSYGSANGAILDGRDIGTVIFPQADVKLFVTASVEARAKRRQLELDGKGQHLTLAEVIADVAARDEADRTRATAPLIPAEDAILIDTTNLNADEAFAHALAIVKEKAAL
ncbi:(d)CMP kinase [Acidocella aminolytica]|uniref:Cytidylate kinase n=1 Tax=Acidocella aminolytica 101 = DSM 11237 TaxID=1120923 RepID=A0A0D6PIJ3_9PROT|nr:(d)CMP kinase [Acidocella aminolytica]GAN81186.1 cytidylate kinase [Acidocella aminolytica 101 = DSM 11237]GBQ40281.1 cytidylate kinase [Acidocella aminolytica 101 = DSM 11237]SHE90944.1 cytidylate kinase [Acidocella aminolytica 101 = DSM 11237]